MRKVRSSEFAGVGLTIALCLGVILSAPKFGWAGVNPGATIAKDRGTGNTAEPATGTVISSFNAKQYSALIPTAAAFALDHGMSIKVGASERLNWFTGFKQATEKYSPQVGLDQHDHILNYVAGMPFPLVEFNDPKAAVKIAYNWHMGPFMPDDFSLKPWGSFLYSIDPEHSTSLKNQEDYNFVCNQFEFLRFAHRTEVEPRPTLGSNPRGVEWKARCESWTVSGIEPDAQQNSGIWIRFLDPDRSDEFYGFSESTRRVRRSVNLFQPNAACRSCHQPYWAYALPKTENFSYRLLGTTSILGCLAAPSEPAGIERTGRKDPKDEKDQFQFAQLPAQMRHAYILEMVPQSQQNLRTIVYIDTEAYLWLAAEFFEDSERIATAFPLWREHPAPDGGSLFDLAGSVYVPTDTMKVPRTEPVIRVRVFRTLVPDEPGFDQKINTGDLPETFFLPQALER